MAETVTLEQVLSQLAREGELYERLPDGRVRCYACGHRCLILPGQKGICRVRWNEDGRLMVPTGYVAALQLDPVEKKPFFHAYPGSRALSFGMLGCDYHCGYCVPADVMIATDQGFVPIGRIFEAAAATSDEAVRVPEALQVITGGGLPHRVLKAFRHQYRGPMAVITPYYFPPLRCTSDHRIIATKDPRGGTVEEVRAADITTEHWLVVPKPAPSGEPRLLDVAELFGDITPTFAVPRSLTPDQVEGIMAASQAGVSSRAIGAKFARNPSYVRHVRSKVRRGVWVYEQVRGLEAEEDRVRFHKERRPGIPRALLLDKSLARLLGYFCAEGSVSRSKSRPNSLTLTFSFGHSEALARDEVATLLRDVFGVTPRLSRRATTTAIEVGKSSLAWLFARLCGEGAAQKRVPAVLFEADPSVQEAFLDAYVAGDGHRYPNGKVSVTTVSAALAYGVAWLALRIGRLPAIYLAAVGPEGEVQGRKVHQAPIQYTVVWYQDRREPRYVETDRYFAVPIKSVATEPFEGYVYNLEVESEHSYLAGFFAVKNCQNWLTSQALRDPVAGVPPQELTPKQIVDLTFRHRARILTSTYNEPLITSEWAVEVFKAGKARGLTCSYVSNGNATPEVLDYIRPWVDLYKVDLKGFDDKHYRKLGGILKTVLDSIRLLHQKGFWLEIVTLVVPGFNDSDEELRDIAKFLVSVSPDIPWHVTAFHQDYKMTDRENTTAKTLIRAAEFGVAAGLRYVYAGNLPGRVGPFENTYCPSCKSVLIERIGYTILKDLLTPTLGTCPSCSERIPGVWG